MESKPKTAPKKTAAPKKKPTAKITDVKAVEVISDGKTEQAAEAKTTKAKEKSTFAKVVATSLITSKIVKKAGSKILDSSIQTTKAIAGIYTKAGKTAIKIGKEVIADTTKVVASNQKTVRETSAKAFKETVETIKDSHLIDNPLKGILKTKKAKK